MNTETLTVPSPELKQHAKDLRRDASKVVQDVKKQASAGLKEVKSEASARLKETRVTATDLFKELKSCASEHPFRTFATGLAVGMLLVAWRRS